MIEIKITTDNALQLLLERMKFELRMRQKAGSVKRGLRLEDLSFREAMQLVESSVFDTIFLLPMEIVTSQTNLISIVTSTVKALCRVLRKEEFLLFTEEQASNLIEPIRKYLLKEISHNNFLYN